MKTEKRRQDKTFRRMYHKVHENEYNRMQKQDFDNTFTKLVQK